MNRPALFPWSTERITQFSRTAGAVPAVLFLGALGLRLIHLVEIRTSPFFDAPVVDARVFLEQARQIAGGDLMGGSEPFWQPPLYIYFLALLCRLFPDAYFIAIRVAQALLGSLSCTLIYFIARRIVDSRTAVLAGIFALFYGPTLYFEGELLAVSLEMSINLLLLYAILQALRQEAGRQWLLVGLLAGLAALTRPTALAFVAGLLVWVAFRERRRCPGRWPAILARRWAQIILPLLLVILPVTWRNYLMEPDLVFISSNGGLNFYLGNNPDYERTVGIRPGMEWETMVMEPVHAGFTTAAAKSAFFFRKSSRYIRSTPGDYLVLLGKKLWLFWNGPEVKRNQDIYYARRHSRLLALLLWDRGLAFPFGLVAPLSLVGLWLTRRRREDAFSLVRLYALLYVLSVVLFFVVSRYRMPVVPVLLIFAAWTAMRLVELAAARHYRRLAAVGIPLVGLLALFNQSAASVPEEDAQLYSDLGEVYLRKGEYRQSIAHSLRALELDAHDNYARHNLAVAHFHLGQHREAIHMGRQTAAENPGRPDTQILLGQAYLAAGRPDLADRHLRRALELDPQSGMANYHYGRLLVRRGECAAALPHLQTARQWQPQEFWIRYDLGLAYQQCGRLDQALGELQQAHRLESRRPEAANALGAVHFLRDELDQAHRYFSLALGLAPDNLEAQVNMALVEARKARPYQAAARLEELLERHPQSPAVYQGLLEIYGQLGKTEKAAALRQRLEKSGP